MRLDYADARKAIEHIVDEVYIPALKKRISIFLKEYSDELRKAEQLSYRIGGVPVKSKDVTLDLRNESRALINDLFDFFLITTYEEPSLIDKLLRR